MIQRFHLKFLLKTANTCTPMPTTCTPVLTTALFTMMLPVSIHTRVGKQQHIHRGILFSQEVPISHNGDKLENISITTEKNFLKELLEEFTETQISRTCWARVVAPAHLCVSTQSSLLHSPPTPLPQPGSSRSSKGQQQEGQRPGQWFSQQGQRWEE